MPKTILNPSDELTKSQNHDTHSCEIPVTSKWCCKRHRVPHLNPAVKAAKCWELFWKYSHGSRTVGKRKFKTPIFPIPTAFQDYIDETGLNFKCSCQKITRNKPPALQEANNLLWIQLMSLSKPNVENKLLFFTPMEASLVTTKSILSQPSSALEGASQQHQAQDAGTKRAWSKCSEFQQPCGAPRTGKPMGGQMDF